MEAADIDSRTDCGDWIDCPHCNQKILVQFKSKVWIQKTEGPSDRTTPPRATKLDAWEDSLSQKQKSVIEHAKRTGLYDSFVTALERGPHHGLPKNKEKYFLEWLKMCKQKLIPAWALSEFQDLYRGKYVEFFSFGFVGGVVAGGEIVLFMPVDLINGLKVKTAVNGEKRMGQPDVSGVRQWIKTKMGYVPAEATVFLSEIKKRSIGEFANPSL